jgi:hypothetical protein
VSYRGAKPPLLVAIPLMLLLGLVLIGALMFLDPMI